MVVEKMCNYGLQMGLPHRVPAVCFAMLVAGIGKSAFQHGAQRPSFKHISSSPCTYACSGAAVTVLSAQTAPMLMQMGVSIFFSRSRKAFHMRGGYSETGSSWSSMVSDETDVGRGVRMMAAPRKKLPERSVDVCCSNCRAKLYKYKKGNGKARDFCFLCGDPAGCCCLCSDLRSLYSKYMLLLYHTHIARHCVVHLTACDSQGSQLVKCYIERIVNDYTAGDLTCHECGTEFAREATIHGRPANKIIGGKVFMK